MLCHAIFEKISARFFFDTEMFSSVYCYSSKGDHITLNSLIKSGKHACVMGASLPIRVDERNIRNVPVVVKWYQSEKRDVSYESKIYARLYEAGCPTPWFSTKYRFWEDPVLVLEHLASLDPSDDPYALGIAVLHQLTYLHKFGIHCDLKPQNIMKRVDERDKSVKYFVIDYGGVSLEKLEYGYRRWIWSPKWTCQPSHQSGQVVTPVEDFIELGFVMKAIKNWNKSGKREDGDCKSNYHGRLRSYMDRVKRIDRHRVKESDYIDLAKILAGDSR
jgi:serine/threonine protein kinase